MKLGAIPHPTSQPLKNKSVTLLKSAICFKEYISENYEMKDYITI